MQQEQEQTRMNALTLVAVESIRAALRKGQEIAQAVAQCRETMAKEAFAMAVTGYISCMREACQNAQIGVWMARIALEQNARQLQEQHAQRGEAAPVDAYADAVSYVYTQLRSRVPDEGDIFAPARLAQLAEEFEAAAADPQFAQAAALLYVEEAQCE